MRSPRCYWSNLYCSPGLWCHSDVTSVLMMSQVRRGFPPHCILMCDIFAECHRAPTRVLVPNCFLFSRDWTSLLSWQPQRPRQGASFMTSWVFISSSSAVAVKLCMSWYLIVLHFKIFQMKSIILRVRWINQLFAICLCGLFPLITWKTKRCFCALIPEQHYYYTCNSCYIFFSSSFIRGEKKTCWFSENFTKKEKSKWRCEFTKLTEEKQNVVFESFCMRRHQSVTERAVWKTRSYERNHEIKSCLL